MQVIDSLIIRDVSKMVVQFSVSRLICSYVQQQIPHSSILLHVVVVNGILGGSHILPLRELALVELFY